jgi:hypothetical protein
VRQGINIIIMVVAFAAVSVSVHAQTQPLFGTEPSSHDFGAPLYPGAEFIRILPYSSPYLETAMYISAVPNSIVEDFFKRKLSEKRTIVYDTPDLYLTGYLLRTWSKFPLKPKREDIDKLQLEPSLQIRQYDPEDLEPIAQYYEKQPKGNIKALTIRKGETMLLYTYEKPQVSTEMEKIAGVWIESSRDLPLYYGARVVFTVSGEYTYTATANNIAALAKDPSVRERLGGKSEAETVAELNRRNPEKGTFSVLSNVIALDSKTPLDGIARKTGLADVGSATLSLELIGKPRLTFIKTP